MNIGFVLRTQVPKQVVGGLGTGGMVGGVSDALQVRVRRKRRCGHDLIDTEILIGILILTDEFFRLNAAASDLTGSWDLNF